MTITFNDSHDRQTTPTDNHAPAELNDTTAAQILIDLSSPAPSPTSPPSPGTPPLGDRSPPILPIDLLESGLSIPEICSDRTGLSPFVNEFLDSDVEVRIQITLKAVNYILSSTPRLRSNPRSTRPAQHLSQARAALLALTKKHIPPPQPQGPSQRSYRDAVHTRPKPPSPPPRRLVPLNRPRQTLPSPTRPPPIPWHSRPASTSPLPSPVHTAGDLAKLSRKQLIDLLLDASPKGPLHTGAPQFGAFRAGQRRAFRPLTLNSVLTTGAYTPGYAPTRLLPSQRFLPSQDHAFAQTNPRRQRLAQRQ